MLAQHLEYQKIIHQGRDQIMFVTYGYNDFYSKTTSRENLNPFDETHQMTVEYNQRVWREGEAARRVQIPNYFPMPETSWGNRESTHIPLVSSGWNGSNKVRNFKKNKNPNKTFGVGSFVRGSQGSGWCEVKRSPCGCAISSACCLSRSYDFLRSRLDEVWGMLSGLNYYQKKKVLSNLMEINLGKCPAWLYNSVKSSLERAW